MLKCPHCGKEIRRTDQRIYIAETITRKARLFYCYRKTPEDYCLYLHDTREWLPTLRRHKSVSINSLDPTDKNIYGGFFRSVARIIEILRSLGYKDSQIFIDIAECSNNRQTTGEGTCLSEMKGQGQ